jgi:LAS superfamily LD-carboxypeptidase LdcB
MLRFLFIGLLALTTVTSFAQSKRRKAKKEEVVVPEQQPSSLAPAAYPQKVYEPKKKRATGKVTYDARNKFYDRMEALEKANRKAEKEMQKPQYSDPMYFGHKRPPKKRPVSKMKFCKVCGIRH